MRPWLLVAADFVRTGGMDVANYALATHLAERGHPVHLVTYSAERDLSTRPEVTVHQVPKVASSYLASEPLLDRVGRHWAKKIAAIGGRVLVNGGNCHWSDVNWVHYVHAAYESKVESNLARRLKNTLAHRFYERCERSVLPLARVVIANSERTKRDLVERLGLSPARVHTVYYGNDRQQFRPPTPSERAASRAKLGWPEERPIVVFIGALGDRRKGFDTLFDAWAVLCSDRDWDADLAVVGTGAELAAWQSRAVAAGLGSRIHFLGFRPDVPSILAGCDVLVAPTRYEAYGLGVQEALCCGMPALVSEAAGVAERYPPELRHLLIPDPNDAEDLAGRLRSWRAHTEQYRAAAVSASKKVFDHDWDQMASQLVATAEVYT